MSRSVKRVPPAGKGGDRERAELNRLLPAASSGDLSRPHVRMSLLAEPSRIRGTSHGICLQEHPEQGGPSLAGGQEWSRGMRDPTARQGTHVLGVVVGKPLDADAAEVIRVWSGSPAGTGRIEARVAGRQDRKAGGDVPSLLSTQSVGTS